MWLNSKLHLADRTDLFNIKNLVFFPQQPPMGQGLLIQITHDDAPQSVGLLWTSDQPVVETTYNTHNRQISMLTVGFKPAISTGERPQTYALDCAATGTGSNLV
jgi:hypothetical protein